MTHEGKYGFHPCNFEQFKKLKRLHKAYWKGLNLVAKRKRWKAKMPRNRTKEIVVPPVFDSIINSNIVYVYHLARQPMCGPEGVTPISQSYWEVVEEQIRALETAGT
jgi:hypothetical protein